METTFSNMNLKMSFPTNGAKLMKHKLVSKSGQIESLVVCEGMFHKGHRCGACHNVSDAKVRIIIKQSKGAECTLKVFVHISYLPLTV